MSLRWEDERYVRVYTRDTVAWRMLPWQSKALIGLLFRKVDRAGLLDLGEYGVEGLATVVELPLEVVEPGLAGLLKAKTAVLTGPEKTVLFVPNFLVAQEAISSDAQRKRDQRERATARVKYEVLTGGDSSVTQRDVLSRNRINGHVGSLEVTSGHSVPSVPSLAVPSVPSKEIPAVKPPPLPFKPDEAVLALAAASGGRFTASKLSKGQAINAQKLIRETPDLVSWQLVGEWLVAGGDGWRGDLDVRNLGDFPMWLAHAQKWADGGKGAVGKKNGSQLTARDIGYRAPMPARLVTKQEKL